MTIQILLLIVLMAGSFAQAANNKCAALLSSPRNLAQDKIKSQEQIVQALIQEYGQHLGPYQDPFALAFSSEQGDRIFKRLSKRTQNGKWVNSPLFIINYNLKRAFTGQQGYNEKLIQWLIDDSSRWLRERNIDRTDLQSNLLALKYTLEYLRRYKEPETVVDRDGKKESSPEPSKSDEEIEDKN